MNLIASIFASDILPIFILAGVGFVLARRFRAEVRTLSTVAFNALSPCLVFYQLVTAKISGAQSIRVAAFCVLLTLAIGIVARLTSLPLRLDRMTLSSFLLVAMFSNSGNYALPVVLFALAGKRWRLRASTSSPAPSLSIPPASSSPRAATAASGCDATRLRGCPRSMRSPPPSSSSRTRRSRP